MEPQRVERIMNFYIIVSLVAVFGLLLWWLFLAISALRNESQGDKRIIDASREDFARILWHGRRDIAAGNNKGLALYSQGEYNETANANEEAIGLNPKDADAWNKKRRCS
jgi:tetratricopeptide (TPR) repeat protein